jgi:hypothetical protein
MLKRIAQALDKRVKIHFSQRNGCEQPEHDERPQFQLATDTAR